MSPADQMDGARHGGHQPQQGADEGGLAAAGGADNADALPGLGVEGEVLENVSAALIGEAQVLGPDGQAVAAGAFDDIAGLLADGEILPGQLQNGQQPPGGDGGGDGGGLRYRRRTGA